MFFVLLVAWLLKTTSAKLQASDLHAEFVQSVGEWLGNAALGSGAWVHCGVLLNRDLLHVGHLCDFFAKAALGVSRPMGDEHV
jgi:uncharacterized membrane protein